MSGNQGRTKGEGLVDRKLVQARPTHPHPHPHITERERERESKFIAGRPKAALCFGSLVILDVVRCYLLLFLLYIYRNR